MFEKKLSRADMLKCALCQDAPCSKACGRMDPAGLLRSIWFDDEKTAAARLETPNPCITCHAPCEDACVRPHQVPIRDLLTRLYDEVKPELEIPLSGGRKQAANGAVRRAAGKPVPALILRGCQHL